MTITNSTRGQVFSPPIVISHNRNFSLFYLGAPASPQLALLAEDGDASDLVDLIDTLPSVYDYTVADDPLPPGESVTLAVRARGSL